MAIDVYSLNNFCDGWLRKAENYRTDRLSDPFDEFFTLFVVYNRLYVEIGKILIHKRHPSVARFLSQRRFVRERQNALKPIRPLPDKISAVELTEAYLRKNNLINEIIDTCEHEIDYLANSIENGSFYFNYDYESDAPDLVRDRKLAEGIRKGSVKSVLELIYVARCNMFHGSKEFHDIQRRLLSSMSGVLRCVSNMTLPCLVQDITEHNNQIQRTAEAAAD
ncbi:hypothetical protein [Alteromonas sp. C1M14]|uniref:hypothetical protein n=1 Tax=Alteromonas sp. C1M14 TaxID=2841567 RepID=UPI001C091609|nr:hypothetical protein [Alteromonas sp. C1M14]MBU2978801.1 hypothetical protein [Alteromonas sp. C1M14]